MKDRLEALYRARRTAFEAEAAVLDQDDEGALVSGLEGALEDVLGSGDRTERSFRLLVLSDLLGRVTHPGATGLLLKILNQDDPSVRARAAQAIGRGGPDRGAILARVALEALEAGLEGPALLELPGLLLDVRDDEAPPPLDVLVQLLDREEPDVAAEAACALAEIDTDGVRDLLDSFRADERPLSDVLDGPATLGELVDQILRTLELADDLGRSEG